MLKHFKRISLLCWIALLSSNFVQAQVNLVPNPSFEQYVQCPNGQGQIPYANAWTSCNSFTPDYFNACSSNFSVPKNWGGYQVAATGNAYTGIYTYESADTNVREIIGCSLASPLTIGTKYYFSFKASLAIDTSKIFNRATNNIGMRFSTVAYSSISPAPIDNFAHVYSSAVITDTSSWCIISGSFTADSAYQFVSIGNFFQDSSTTIAYFQDTLVDQAAYYFIDDAYVSTDSINGIETIVKKDDVLIYPNPFSEVAVVRIPSLTGSSEVGLVLYDCLGRKVIEKQIVVRNKEFILPQYDLPSGIYTLSIMDNSKSYSRKIAIN